jgi:hypothetical protein
MNKTSFLFLGAALSASAFLLVGTGCSSSSNNGNTGGTGGTTGTGGSSAGLDCTTYCTEVMTNCTGANAQYADMGACMGTCAGFPKGALADTSGDTLGCRIYHGGAPAMGDPTMHCPHAGPTGGDKDPTDTNAGSCGEACDAFCNIAMTVCTGTNAQFTDMTACMTTCKGFTADTSDYNSTDFTSKNDYGCRMYHLTAASEGGPAAATHCPHIGAESPVCTM